MAEYIEREALLRLMGKPPSIAVPTDSELRLIKCVISTLENFPAADVRPVVRGKWNVGSEWGWECSVCGIESNNTYPICPYCGAWMEES